MWAKEANFQLKQVQMTVSGPEVLCSPVESLHVGVLVCWYVSVSCKESQ